MKGKIIQIVACVMFMLDISLHLFGKLTDTNATYLIVIDIFIFLLGMTWDREE
jgi:hypothetical protein